MYFDHRDDQEELRQEIILRLWEAFSSFRGESKFSSWMYRVALNTAITFFKRSRRRAEVQVEDAELEIVAPANLDEESKRRVDDFYRAVNRLNRIEKAVVFLFIEGCSHREIGKHLGISEGNARVKLSRTKSKLQTELRTNYGPE